MIVRAQFFNACIFCHVATLNELHQHLQRQHRVSRGRHVTGSGFNPEYFSPIQIKSSITFSAGSRGRRVDDELVQRDVVKGDQLYVGKVHEHFVEDEVSFEHEKGLWSGKGLLRKIVYCKEDDERASLKGRRIKNFSRRNFPF